MKPTVYISAAILAAAGAATQANETVRLPERSISDSFVLDAHCERGVSHIRLDQIDGATSIDIGAASRDSVEKAETAALLGGEARAAIGEQFMTDELLRSDLSFCGGGVSPTVDAFSTGDDETAEAKPGAHICYPVSNCGLFDWFCGFIGGSLINNDDGGPLSDTPHHICIMPKPKKPQG